MSDSPIIPQHHNRIKYVQSREILDLVDGYWVRSADSDATLDEQLNKFISDIGGFITAGIPITIRKDSEASTATHHEYFLTGGILYVTAEEGSVDAPR